MAVLASSLTCRVIWTSEVCSSEKSLVKTYSFLVRRHHRVGPVDLRVVDLEVHRAGEERVAGGVQSAAAADQPGETHGILLDAELRRHEIRGGGRRRCGGRRRRVIVGGRGGNRHYRRCGRCRRGQRCRHSTTGRCSGGRRHGGGNGRLPQAAAAQPTTSSVPAQRAAWNRDRRIRPLLGRWIVQPSGNYCITPPFCCKGRAAPMTITHRPAFGYKATAIEYPAHSVCRWPAAHGVCRIRDLPSATYSLAFFCRRFSAATVSAGIRPCRSGGTSNRRFAPPARQS